MVEPTSTPLFNIEAEQGVLGALLVDSSRAWPLVRSLRPDHFAEPIHARIYAAIDTLAVAGKVAGFVTVKNAFDQDQTLEELGGTKYLASLAANAATALSARAYADVIRDLAARRAAIGAAEALIEDVSLVSLEKSFRQAIAAHVESMQRLFEDGSERRTSFSIGEATADLVTRVNRMRAGEADPNAVKTGIGVLDKFTGGFHRGEYIVLGARPSMGKTALATQIAYNVAARGGGVFYASLEMPSAQITPRFVSCRMWASDGATSLIYKNILEGNVDERAARWLASVAEELKAWPLVIEEAPGLTASEVEARAQIAKAKFERQGKSLDLVVIDHIHKMRHPGCQSKVSEFTEISSRLAEMAKRLDVPTFALAQLNRSTETRDDKRPQLSDLRESGSIEQDADTAMFVYRPAYYLERKRLPNDPYAEADRMAALGVERNRLEILIEKQRNGPIGTVELWCDMASNVVRDPAELPGLEMAA
jgi:replicative DNA helicase